MYYLKSMPCLWAGWTDWANFHQFSALQSCTKWIKLWLLFSQKRPCLKFNKRRIGSYIGRLWEALGRFCHQYIWSPWLRASQFFIWWLKSKLDRLEIYALAFRKNQEEREES
jgi:hypothetical protein